MRLAVDGLSVRISRAELVSSIDFVAESGEFVAIIGPNGSGKSTVLKTLYRALEASAGTIWLGDERLSALTPRRSAQRIAALTQEHGGDFAFSVRDVVALGLTPHKRALQADSESDRTLVADCMRRVGVDHLAERRFPSLSGGEKQRALLAAALVQRPQILVLDEPTNHLDIATQLALLTMVRGLGITVIAALHDLNLAAAYCDRVYLVEHGRVVGGGSALDVLGSPELISRVFGVDVHVGTNPASGCPHLFFALHHQKEKS